MKDTTNVGLNTQVGKHLRMLMVLQGVVDPSAAEAARFLSRLGNPTILMKKAAMRCLSEQNPDPEKIWRDMLWAAAADLRGPAQRRIRKRNMEERDRWMEEQS